MVAEQANSAPVSNHLPFYETDRTFELLDKFVDSWNNQNTNSPLIPWFHKYICLICPFRYSLLSKQPILKRQPRDECLGICPGNKMLFRQLMQLCFSLIISQVSVNLNLPLSTEKCTTFCIPPYNYWTQYKWKILWDETTMHWHKAINSLILLIVLLA